MRVNIRAKVNRSLVRISTECPYANWDKVLLALNSTYGRSAGNSWHEIHLHTINSPTGSVVTMRLGDSETQRLLMALQSHYRLVAFPLFSSASAVRVFRLNSGMGIHCCSLCPIIRVCQTQAVMKNQKRNHTQRSVWKMVR